MKERACKPGSFQSKWNKIEEIPVEWLKNRVRGVILDVDNTLLNWGDHAIPQEVIQWLKKVERAGIRICLLSNTWSKKARHVYQRLGFPCIAPALKPLPFGYWKALHHLHLQRKEVLVIGDQLLTDILGARLSGISGLLLPPRNEKEFFLTRIFSRRLEKWLSKLLNPR
ncbi:MAG: YqeG family HAD IIIA-type phosphatase [bacterium JZ-2024 1]